MPDTESATRFIRVETSPGDRVGVALVTIERADALNALSFAVLAELADALEALDRDGSTRAVVLTGAGQRAFAAGADIAELHDQTPKRLQADGHFLSLGPDRCRRAAGHRGRPRVCAGWRLRAGHVVRPDHRR